MVSFAIYFSADANSDTSGNAESEWFHSLLKHDDSAILMLLQTLQILGMLHPKLIRAFHNSNCSV
jgi:hypothetical protein